MDPLTEHTYFLIDVYKISSVSNAKVDLKGVIWGRRNGLIQVLFFRSFLPAYSLLVNKPNSL